MLLLVINSYNYHYYDDNLYDKKPQLSYTLVNSHRGYLLLYLHFF